MPVQILVTNFGIVAILASQKNKKSCDKIGKIGKTVIKLIKSVSEAFEYRLESLKAHFRMPKITSFGEYEIRCF